MSGSLVGDIFNAGVDLLNNSPLKLGDFSFTGLEIPENIPFGGKMQYNKKVLVGGRVVLESTGYEYHDPTWTGRFQGQQAYRRAKSVEAMVKAGLPVTLSYGGMQFKVLITSFTPNYERKFQIPYTITCCIASVAQPASGFLDDSLYDLIGGDTVEALGLTDIIGDTTLGEAMDKVSSTLNSAGSLLGIPQLTKFGNYVNGATDVARGIQTGNAGAIAGAVFGAASTFTSGTAASAKLSQAAGYANNLANSTAAANLLGRMSSTIGL